VAKVTPVRVRKDSLFVRTSHRCRTAQRLLEQLENA
jgi:hypothetical protein